MRIAFLCPQLEFAPWDDTSLETGVGGSGAMVIQYARELAKENHVTVFCNVKNPGMYHGVTWLHSDGIGGVFDVALALRTPEPLKQVTAKVRGYVANDQTCDPLPLAVKEGTVNLIITISKHQTQNYQRFYPEIPKSMYLPSSAGVDWYAYTGGVPKDYFLCNYTSTPERGLDNLIRLWPQIHERQPRASLVATGGFQLYGMTEEQATEHSRGLYEQLAALPNATYAGPLPRKELIELQMRSALWLYPTAYEEQCCISALEAMSAKQVLITSPLAALKERVGTNGFLIEPGFWYDEHFVNRAVETLGNQPMIDRMGAEGSRLAAYHNYDVLAYAWLMRFRGML